MKEDKPNMSRIGDVLMECAKGNITRDEKDEYIRQMKFSFRG